MRQTIVIGDSLDFETTVDLYPASEGWVPTYRLVPRTAGPAPIELTGVASEDAYRFQAAAAVTAGWTAGEYSFVLLLARTGLRVTAERGHVTLIVNPALATVWDLRTEAVKALDDAKAALAAYTVNSTLASEYSIGGRSMKFKSVDEIVQLIRYWENEVAREQRRSRVLKGVFTRVR